MYIRLRFEEKYRKEKLGMAFFAHLRLWQTPLATLDKVALLGGTWAFMRLNLLLV